MNKILLDEDEAAASLGISARTFQNLRNEPWMPPTIVLGPRLLRWSIDELRAAVGNMPRQTGRVQPESLRRARVEKAEKRERDGLRPSRPGIPRVLDVGDGDEEPI